MAQTPKRPSRLLHGSQRAIKICAYHEESGELNEIISTGYDPHIVKIPGIYWHGFKVIGNETAWLLYFTTKL